MDSSGQKKSLGQETQVYWLEDSLVDTKMNRVEGIDLGSQGAYDTPSVCPHIVDTIFVSFHVHPF